jgi:hypothetical protein
MIDIGTPLTMVLAETDSVSSQALRCWHGPDVFVH